MNRVLIAVSSLLALLLLVLAVLQYRWAGRIAEADTERTLTQLRRSASLLAQDFDMRLTEAYTVIQTQGMSIQNGAALHAPPAVTDLIASMYAVETGDHGQVFRLDGESRWQLSPNDPHHAENAPCNSTVDADLPALVVPAPVSLPLGEPGLRPLEMVSRCVHVQLNSSYIRDTLFPSLIDKYFGKDAQNTYQFTVTTVGTKKTVFPQPAQNPVAATADVRQELFSLRPENLLQRALAPFEMHTSGPRIFIRSVTGRMGGTIAYRRLPDAAAWELDIRNRSGPLVSSFARWREGSLVTSLVVELMLMASIGVLIFASRRQDMAARQKMQFVAGVSHELRTPVSAILMLSRNQADGLVQAPEQVRQYGSLIHQQSQRLSEMVEQTLQFAGIHSHYRKPEWRSIEIADVVEKAVAARRPELTDAGFEVETEIASDLPPLVGDPQWLEEAVGNLLSNAMKYSQDQRWIRVIAAPDIDGKTVAITVEDRGIGIDPADQQRLFEPFFRGHRAVAAQIPGSGLGLSLVRSAAEAHHGTVSFSSEPDQGSRFTLRIPAVQNG